MTVLAQYHGTCTECGEPVAPGQRIQPDDDEQGWQHADCGEMPATVQCVCSRCFLVHAPAQVGCD